jgi:hypothetical protein
MRRAMEEPDDSTESGGNARAEAASLASRLTREQRAPLHDDESVLKVVRAVAGAGKSTYLMAEAERSAQRRPDGRMLLLTYNARLRHEGKERALRHGLGDHLVVHTYHSWVRSVWGPWNAGITRDEDILAFVQSGEPPRRRFRFCTIAADEVQDMTPLLFACLLKTLHYNALWRGTNRTRLLVVGDERQCIYQYRGADSRFLTLAAALLQTGPAREFRFHVCHRSSPRIVSRHIAQEPGLLVAGEQDPPGARVSYLVGNPFSLLPGLLGEWLSRGVRPGDIFVLAPAVRAQGNTPLKTLATWCRNQSPPVPVHVHDQEQEPDPETIHGKLYIGTIHSTKGSERDCVLAVGVTEHTVHDVDVPLNLAYVACTRARRFLAVVRNQRSSAASWVNEAGIAEDPEVLFRAWPDPGRGERGSQGSGAKTRPIFVTDLLRHASELSLHHLVAMANLEIVQVDSLPALCADEWPTSTEGQNGQRESVRDLMGASVSAYYQLLVRRQEPNVRESVDMLLHTLQDLESSGWSQDRPAAGTTVFGRLRGRLDRIKVCNRLEAIHEITAIDAASQSKLLHRLDQIQDWSFGLAPAQAQDIAEQVARLLQSSGADPDRATFEAPCEMEHSETARLCGRADILEPGRNLVLELKLKQTDRPMLQDVLQLLCYGVMIARTTHQMPALQLAYLISGQVYQISAPHLELAVHTVRQMVEIHLNRSHAADLLDDAAFVAQYARDNYETQL